MMVIFGALMWWLVVAKQLVFRILAACLAFIPAMVFGVAAVNKYYDYYQNWNAAFSDLSGSDAQPELPYAATAAPSSSARCSATPSDTALAAAGRLSPSGSPCAGRPAT